MTRATVISVFHNRADTVPRTVESLLAQDYGELDIVLVDDGSRDGTPELLRGYESERVRVIAHPNKGFTAALRDAIATTDSEFIAIHGSGDVSFPARISTQIALLDLHPEAVAAGCGIVNADELTGSEWEVLPRETYRAGPIERRFGISHGELVMRRNAYDSVGGYRTFFSVGQVSDLLRRMTLLGGIVYAHDVLYRRYLTPAGVSGDPEKIAMRNLYAALSMQVLRRRPQTVLELNGKLPPDAIDRYGALAPYFLPPDAQVARAAAAAATQMLALNNRADAKLFAAMSMRNKLTWRGLVACGFAWFAPRAAPLRLKQPRFIEQSEHNPTRFAPRAKQRAGVRHEGMRAPYGRGNTP